MLGDVAVAVNPQDHRHAHLIGKQLEHPFRNGELLPVIADEYVDPKVGSGAVKITPGHDHNDFEIGQRHQLPIISVIDENGDIALEGSVFNVRKPRVKYLIPRESRVFSGTSAL